MSYLRKLDMQIKSMDNKRKVLRELEESIYKTCMDQARMDGNIIRLLIFIQRLDPKEKRAYKKRAIEDITKDCPRALRAFNENVSRRHFY